ncbi:uncharacterized protein LOC111704190 isoform X2 [Eurytemora carolleeae]|uniref:uncharacterized protein LOC111704190 isoform X2 n=1 Tax=Eurytemora carolleeae TaxID=1294199 RepID=UPI000C772EF4|nr:uncharacterized protein LOC111704190 isoform X2 [Eurytemora carolleeae]|eukprot:XP_023332113.1 uncharacterized protein LOC111704190 isoform X2 [Eurytemora affinis]
MIKIFIFLTAHALAIPGDNGPPGLTDKVLFCDGCFAMISEIFEDLETFRELAGNTRLIEETLANICDHQRLRRYKFSPPTQKKTCLAIQKHYNNELVKLVSETSREKEKELDNLVELFCFQITGACAGMKVPTVQMRRYIDIISYQYITH